MSTFTKKSISVASIFHGFGLFLFVFAFSMALGIVFGLACSLMLKHSRLSTYPPLESALVLLIAYTSYFFSNGVNMSGAWQSPVNFTGTDYHHRHRKSFVLWHYTQTLRLPQHVQKDTKSYAVYFSNAGKLV